MSDGRDACFGLTIIELLVVIAILALLGSLLLPALAKGGGDRLRVSCLSNLRQLSFALGIWSEDHVGLFPWEVPGALGGTAELTSGSEVFRHFQALSNAGVSPKVLVCPRDSRKERAASFTNFSNANVSYFVSLDARGPNSIELLSGDGNIQTVQSGFLRELLSPFKDVGWSGTIHPKGGNIAWSDGRAEYTTRSQLQKILRAGPLTKVQLAIP